MKNNISNHLLMEEAQNMVKRLKDRIEREFPDFGESDRIYEKTTKGISDSYVKELRLEFFQRTFDMRYKLAASIIDAKNNRQYAPLSGGSKEEIIAFLNEKETVDIIANAFETLIRFARA